MSTFRFLFLLSAIVELTDGCRRRRQPCYPPPRTTSRLPRHSQSGGWTTTRSTPSWIQPEVTKRPSTTKPSPSWIQPEVTKRPTTTKPSPSWIQPEVTEPPKGRPTPSSTTTNVPMATGRTRTSPGPRPRPTPSTLRVSTATSITVDLPKPRHGEAKSTTSPTDGSTGGGSEGDTNDDGRQPSICRTSATTTAMCTPRKTTAVLAGSPVLPPPQTAIYFHWMVEAFLALLVVVIAICLAIKMRNLKTAAGDSEPEHLIVSGTTSYEEIGNINRSRRSDSTVTPDSRQSPEATCEQRVQSELAIAAGNLYENAREISRRRDSRVHTYENIDTILYEDMRRQLDQQIDDNYEKLQRSCSTSSRFPGNETSGGFYNSLVDAKRTPEASDTKCAMKHSVTTDLERFADCSDESGGHM